MQIENVSHSASSHVLAAAVLVSDVTFIDSYGHQVVLQKGTEVLVDLQESIGNYEDYHFDLNSEEYFVLPLAMGVGTADAVTLKDISFTCAQGLSVTIPSGSKLTVDEESSIAYFAGHHFDIHQDEFRKVDSIAA